METRSRSGCRYCSIVTAATRTQTQRAGGQYHGRPLGGPTESAAIYHAHRITDEPDGGDGHIADYRQTLAKRYQSYLTGLNEWAEEYLDMELSAQISYNLPMAMLANILY